MVKNSFMYFIYFNIGMVLYLKYVVYVLRYQAYLTYDK